MWNPYHEVVYMTRDKVWMKDRAIFPLEDIRHGQSIHRPVPPELTISQFSFNPDPEYMPSERRIYVYEGDFFNFGHYRYPIFKEQK
jgi:hypothetical protein